MSHIANQHRSLMAAALCLATLLSLQAQEPFSCNTLEHIYCATTAASTNPANDASRLYRYSSANGYTQVDILDKDLVYPGNFPVVALQGKKIQLNGIAINPKDGLLYGFDVINSNRLLKIGSDGTIYNQGLLKPLNGNAGNTFPTNSLTNYNTFTDKVGGACFDQNGILYVATSTQYANINGQNPANGFARIWTITGLDDNLNNNNYSRLRYTDQSADGGYGDLLINVKDLNEIYVAQVGAWNGTTFTNKGIKVIDKSTNTWTAGSLIFNSGTEFPSGNHSILGLSYNEKGDFVGITNAAAGGTGSGVKRLFTIDACGTLLEYTSVPTGPFTGDGTSIFPF